MSDASEWIVVLAYREFPSTPQFVPSGVSHAGFALACLGAILRVGGGDFTRARSRQRCRVGHASFALALPVPREVKAEIPV